MTRAARDGMGKGIDSVNGISITTSSATYRLDPGRTVMGDCNVVSHAHSDHLPRGGNEQAVVASRETIALARMRTGRDYSAARHPSVKLLDAGHVPGSRMVLVKDDLSYLYTGDFCTKRKVYLHNARPVRTDVLFIESTYGLPKYRFPDPVELAGVIRDWAADTLNNGSSILFSLYPLGKAQEIEVILRGMPLFAEESVARHNSIVFGRDSGWIRPLSEMGGGPGIIISSGRNIYPQIQPQVRRRMLRATASGWSLEGRFSGGYDEAFPLSDHSDYYDLIEFVRRCSPSMVYTVHGFDMELASSIRRELGIEARPLRARREKQRKIDSY